MINNNLEELKEVMHDMLNVAFEKTVMHRKVIDRVDDELIEDRDAEFTTYSLYEASCALGGLMLLRGVIDKLPYDEQIFLMTFASLLKTSTYMELDQKGFSDEDIEGLSMDIGGEILNTFTPENVAELIKLYKEKRPS